MPGSTETAKIRRLHSRRAEITQFETIPAWRVARLRVLLREAQTRGLDPTEEAPDFGHRALNRRFALGRRLAQARAAHPRTTRKGRSFGLDKKVALWRAILARRPEGWRQGERVPKGAIAGAHDDAIIACRALGVAAPRYSTVYALWHRGVPEPEVVAALRGERRQS